MLDLSRLTPKGVVEKPVKNRDGRVVGTTTIKKYRLWEGEVVLLVDSRKFRYIAAAGEVPEYFHAKLHGVDVHLRDDLIPGTTGITFGKAEIGCREVTSTLGDEVARYMYVNIFPSAGGETEYELVLGRADRPGERAAGHSLHWEQIHLFPIQAGKDAGAAAE